jgi:hypothetical protein
VENPTMDKVQKVSNCFVKENICVFKVSCRLILQDDVRSRRVLKIEAIKFLVMT